MKWKTVLASSSNWTGPQRPSSLKTAEVENHYFQNLFLTGLALLNIRAVKGLLAHSDHTLTSSRQLAKDLIPVAI